MSDPGSTTAAGASPIHWRHRADAVEERAPYGFLPSEGEGLHQIPVGPVHAGIIEPGHFRFTANGETIVRLEERLGYVHKGIESLMTGASIAQAARLAGRTSGDSTVAYAFAFARAVEAALGIEVPPRAVWLRALMAELERLANHLGDIGAICNDAAFALMHAHCAVLREHVLRAAATCFGHRLMMDRIVPGGVDADLAPEGAVAVRLLLATIRSAFPALIELYDNTASLQDRTVSTGMLDPALARRFGAGGHVGRASGRSFDARRTLAYPPYDSLRFEVPVRQDGDVNARVWIRIREVEQSLGLVEQILERLPPGEVCVPVAGTGEPRLKGWRSSKPSAATCSSGYGSMGQGRSRGVTCAIPPGSSGRCSKRRSPATSSPISRSATNRSTAPIQGMIFRGSVSMRPTQPLVIAGLVPATPIMGHGRAMMIGVAGTSPAMTIR